MCNENIFSFFPPFVLCVYSSSLQNFVKRKEKLEFYYLNFVTSLALTDKKKIKGTLHWRSTELRTDIEITYPVILSVSLKLFSTKTKQCFVFIPPAFIYLVGALREKDYI